MKLSDKILELRKRRGLSQEALAELLGVSRQAISKWENGDAIPEIFKLKMIADLFGVTTDWLLSEEGMEDNHVNPHQSASDTGSDPMPTADWVDKLPNMLGGLIRQYGWLAGIEMAVGGLLFMGIGGLSIYMSNKIMSPSGMDDFMGGGGMSGMTIFNPVALMGKFIVGLGAILLVGGIILAIALKKWGRKNNQAGLNEPDET